MGNVLATISDKKLGISTDGSTVDHFNPQVLDANDYYPFGSLEPGRTYAAASTGNYRYGFNGKEDDNEVKGVGDQQDYGKRIYDPRVGRFLSLDPLESGFPELTPYQFAGNTPIQAIDLDGAETWLQQQANEFKRQAQMQQFRSDRVETVKPYNPNNRSFTQKWRDSKNVLASIAYHMVNGTYTTGQQLTAGIRNADMVYNLGGNAYHAHGTEDENERINNFADFATTVVPAGKVEATAEDILGQAAGKFITKIQNQVTQQVTERGALIRQLINEGIKVTTTDVVNIGKNAEGKIIFLEAGNSSAGLAHIMRHSEDFAAAGIAKSDIANVVFEAATKGKQIGMQGTRTVYQVMYKGEAKNIAVTIGNNGFIVGANPISK